MLQYVIEQNLLSKPTRSLVATLDADKLLITTEYAKFLMEEAHCRIVRIHSAIYFQMRSICADFFRTMLAERRKAQREGNTVLADLIKLILNSVSHSF